MKEFDLLKHVYAANASLPADVIIPPGDDMGAMRIGEATVLVTVDQVADGVHVDLAKHTLQQVGRKAITRNLSDVAAMAAKPVGAVAAACLPHDFGEARANELFDAMRATAEHYACPLIGGDVSMWSGKLLLTVTVFAEPAGVEPVLRRGARVGDVVCVSGKLGNSIAGHHLTFEPRIDLARQLARSGAHCMIDLSDGLSRDLAHLCRAGDVSAVIREADLPLREGATLPGALGDGEDYELCFTIEPDAALPADVTVIGRVIDRDDAPIYLQRRGGDVELLSETGWEHRGE